MKKLLLSVLMSFVAVIALSQNYSSYAKATITFESEPAGAQVFYNGECIGVTPFTFTFKAEYLNAYGNADAAASAKLDAERLASGEPSGTFEAYPIPVKFVLNGAEAPKTIRLKWSPAKIMGQDGVRIAYPSKVSHSFE